MSERCFTFALHQVDTGCFCDAHLTDLLFGKQEASGVRTFGLQFRHWQVVI